MSTRLISKPVGGKHGTFTIKGPVVGHAFGQHGENRFMLRVYLRWPDYFETYFFELLHARKNRVVESICDRDGHVGKSAVVEAIREAVLQVESEPEIKQVVDRMRGSVIVQIGQFRAPARRLLPQRFCAYAVD